MTSSNNTSRTLDLGRKVIAAHQQMLERDHYGQYVVITFPNFPSADNAQLYFGSSSDEARVKADTKHLTTPFYLTNIGIEKPDYVRGAVSPRR
jgi:hypothetical protein